jgi:hypothetical protein
MVAIARFGYKKYISSFCSATSGRIRIVQILLRTLASMALFFVSEAALADVAVVGKQGDIENILRLRVHGTITKNDLQDVVDGISLLEKHPTAFYSSSGRIPIKIIELDSPGGDVATAISIGKIIRKLGAETRIPNGATCSSSCSLVFVSGVVRHMFGTARLGVHRPRFTDVSGFSNLTREQATLAYNELLASIDNYMHDMHVPKYFVETTRSTPSNSISYIMRKTALSEGIAGEDPAFSEWVYARQIEMQGKDATDALNKYTSCLDVCSDGDNKCKDGCLNILKGVRYKDGSHVLQK